MNNNLLVSKIKTKDIFTHLGFLASNGFLPKLLPFALKKETTHFKALS